jgi:hypothetical protein
MFDRIANPGRAGTAAQMNLDLAKGAQQRQLDAAKITSAESDAVLKQLQVEALKGNPEALDKLRDYYNAMNAYRSNNPDSALWRSLADGQQGAVPDGTMGQARPISSTPTTTPTTVDIPESPTLTQIDNMTPSQVREQAVKDIADIDSRISEQEEVISTGMIPRREGHYGATMPISAGPGASPYVHTVTGAREATVGELKKAQETLTSLRRQKEMVQSTAERYSPTGSRQ